MALVPQRTIPLDDLAAPFQIDGEPVRGRLARLGPAIDEILTRHDYPEPVANLLGETCALAVLVGSSLKFEGRLIVQAQGKGPVSYVVADYDTAGALRGYCQHDAERLAALGDGRGGFAGLGARALLGDGVFIMTIDQGPDMERYQGVTPIEGETLALSAERYFAQSEQTPTRVRLAVGQANDGSDGPTWRSRRHPYIQIHRRGRRAGRNRRGLERSAVPVRDRGRGRVDRPNPEPRDAALSPVPRTRRAALPGPASEGVLPLLRGRDRGGAQGLRA